MLAAFLFLFALLGAAPARAACLESGDETAINALFERVELCPGSVHRLQAPIVLTAPRQTLTTAGQPAKRDRALLLVTGETQSVAVRADCKQCGGARISHLAVDGGRAQMLRVVGGEALLELGNADDQAVEHCRLWEPRGWSALHVREGDELSCRRATLRHNVIGPCGEEWDDGYDGEDEKEPAWGNPRADGISLACRDSLVEHNYVFDTTDGAIVLFGSAGSTVRKNRVDSRTRVVLGGVNLVDYDPWRGDYSRVHVYDNDFFAHSRYFKVGIVVGLSSWSDDTDKIVAGGTVKGNRFHGKNFGYALVVSSADDFTVLDNVVDDDAVFAGVPGARCPTAPENGAPTAFLINRGSSHGTFQPEFVNGEVQHIICVEPEDYVPWRFRDSPESVAAAAEADAEDAASDADAQGTLIDDSRLADALVAYQDKLLSAIEGVERRSRLRLPGQDPVEHGVHARPAAHADGGEDDADAEGAGQERALRHKLERLERAQRKIERELGAFKYAFGQFAEFCDVQIASNNRNLLENVYKQFRERRVRGGAKAGAGASASNTRVTAIKARVARARGVSIAAWVIGLLAFLALFLLVLRRFYAGQRYKGLKTHRQ